MQIQNGSFFTPSFKRAFTSVEKKSYDKLLCDAKKTLGLKDTSAIIFDFNVPSEKGKNTGIGSLWSDKSFELAQFLKNNALVTSVQTGPEGQISNANRSPYSGTNFALGEHIIDLSQLTKPLYGSILSDDDISAADFYYSGDKEKREFKTDYDYIFGKGNNSGVQNNLLKKAFENFSEGISNGDDACVKLNSEFSSFKFKNKEFLEKEFIYSSLVKEYGGDSGNKWSFTDRNLYSSLIKDSERKSRISELNDKYSEEKNFYEFKQFIADKQQREARKSLNEIGVKLYGDCLIGYSESEVWAHPECFTPGLYYGGPDPACSDTNNIQTWQLTAPDFRKTGNCDEVGNLSKTGETGKFFHDKYKTFFSRYDGIRTDAAWQFVTPFIYRENNGNFEQVELPEMNMTMFNIMKTAAKDVLGESFDEKNPENIMLELVGLSAGKSREMTLNEYPHLYTTAYSEYDESPAAFIKKGYRDGMFYVGVGCHDNQSLVEQSKNEEKRNLQMSLILKDYSLNPAYLKFNCDDYASLSDIEQQQEDFRTAKFSEIFTSSKQFFTLPDMFGMEERINISGKVSPDNWSVRIPSDYEKFYYSRLSKGFGLNLPKALANAMIMTGKGDEKIISKCLEASEILRTKGPSTQSEADIAEKNGQLTSSFSYKS